MPLSHPQPLDGTSRTTPRCVTAGVRGTVWPVYGTVFWFLDVHCLLTVTSAWIMSDPTKRRMKPLRSNKASKRTHHRVFRYPKLAHMILQPPVHPSPAPVSRWESTFCAVHGLHDVTSLLDTARSSLFSKQTFGPAAASPSREATSENRIRQGQPAKRGFGQFQFFLSQLHHTSQVSKHRCRSMPASSSLTECP